MDLKDIDTLKNKVLSGGEISRQEALGLTSTDDGLMDVLIEASAEIKKHFSGNQVELCSIISAKTGSCKEDCAYCSQSAHYKTGIQSHNLLPKEVVVNTAKNSQANGAIHFCVVTSGKGPEDTEEFTMLLETIREIGKETNIHRCCSLGQVTLEQARALKEAGIERFNHNLDTSQRYYPNIITSHTFQDRLQTLKNLKTAGIELCSGGIIGMGETWEDRIDLAFTLKELEVDSVPLNYLNPIKGTPLEHVERTPVKDFLKTIAIFRFILPRQAVRYAGGRTLNMTPEEQALGLKAGINAMLIGNYLTTTGRSPTEDMKMLSEMDLVPAPIPLSR